MKAAPFAEVIRGDSVECVHHGSVAVVNTRGELLYQAGDPHFLSFTRSTLKPFQALPFLQTGGPEKFGFAEREIALMCASHSGEPAHIDVVQSMLKRAGCDEHHLRCGCHVPLHYAQSGAQPAPGSSFNQLHNNCSGKHAGFLAYCVHHNLPTAGYLDPGHPLQQAIRKSVSELARLDQSALASGIDGCSAPNYAMPLSRLALAYARLAQDGQDAEYGASLATLFKSMTSHPELVSGTGRNDLVFMQAMAGDWVTKVGAEGVQAIGIRSAGLGIALKVADGNSRALYPATLSVLQQLGLLKVADGSLLADWLRPKMKNCMGMVTGEVRPAVELIKS